eukprot:TRINITY_DN11156_c0_g1_i1.p1 TRINITY_DN11156_c0_g1~~TRINITY_DN11156_c0_g1_i1.p1  ORF type:complete len:111 (+),score=6.12 TRINITY_DN11156_c0_g1_i1:178-510(+)
MVATLSCRKNGEDGEDGEVGGECPAFFSRLGQEHFIAYFSPHSSLYKDLFGSSIPSVDLNPYFSRVFVLVNEAMHMTVAPLSVAAMPCPFEMISFRNHSMQFWKASANGS